MRRFSMIVIVLAAVAVGSVYGQVVWKLRVGVVGGRTVGLPQSPMLPNYTNNDRVQAQMLANDAKPMPHMSDITDARSIYENLSKAPHP